MNWLNWILPENASSYGPAIDRIYYIILIVTGIAFVIVEAGLIWFSFKYRARPGRKAHYTHGSLRAEVIWTAIPAVTVIIIGVMSGGVWDYVKGRESVPAGSLPIEVHAKQFEWNFAYPGPDGVMGTDDDFIKRNELVVPVDTPVVAVLTSEDVIHSMFIPPFRLKQDAVPGMHIRVWFKATRTGHFGMGCAELCGNGHTTMAANVRVVSLAQYHQWLATQEIPTVASR